MLLYLVRHGQTELNEQGIVQGQLNPPLSKLGQEQALKLSEWLKLVPFNEAWSSPLKRAEDTAKIICAKQSKVKLRIDERLTTRGAGDAQGKLWDEVRNKMHNLGAESEEDLSARLHAWLSTLISTHTPSVSGSATPITPLTPSNPNTGPALERALSSIKGLPRPGIDRRGSLGDSQIGKGIVLVVTHQECLSCLLKILTNPDPIITNNDNNIKKTSPIDLHIPEQVNLNNELGNTSLAILRVWWEDGEHGDLVPRGRLEAWGSEDHLQDDDVE